MKNEIPKRSFFDLMLENTQSKLKEKEEKQPNRPNPIFTFLGFIAAPLFFAVFVYFGLDVISKKVTTFPHFSYFDALKLYLGAWVVSSLLKKR